MYRKMKYILISVVISFAMLAGVVLLKTPSKICSEIFPKKLHFIYFPWDKLGKLKEDENDFNHKFYEKFSKKNKKWDIHLWKFSEAKRFIEDNYPEFSNIWSIVKHPVQTVDFFRLLVTYHFGGIYWQYESRQKAPLEAFIPGSDKICKLFVESIITEEFSEKKREERLRNGKPEELIRVANQVFSAYPKDPFLLYCIKKSWNNLNTMEVKSQYDILYVGGNAMISEAYNEYTDKSNIELICNRKKYIKFKSRGSWRMDQY